MKKSYLLLTLLVVMPCIQSSDDWTAYSDYLTWQNALKTYGIAWIISGVWVSKNLLNDYQQDLKSNFNTLKRAAASFNNEINALNKTGFSIQNPIQYTSLLREKENLELYLNTLTATLASSKYPIFFLWQHRREIREKSSSAEKTLIALKELNSLIKRYPGRGPVPPKAKQAAPQQ